MTDAQAIDELEARLTASCDREALLALADRREDPRARAALRRHLASCPACRGESLWLAELERLLGPLHEEHPAAAALSAYVEGGLAAEERARIAAHLARCERCALLRRGAEAGLAEAERVLAGLALAEARAAGEAVPEETELHLPLELPRPPAARAFAAEAGIAGAPGTERAGHEPAPHPEDRQILLEQEGARVVYHRLGAEAWVALYGELAQVELELWLDAQPLAPALREPGSLHFALGPAGELGGRALRLELRLGPRRLRRSFTVVESAEEE